MRLHFRGFRDLDFKGTDGTTWRSRKQFGGDIAYFLNQYEEEKRFQSWATYRQQEIQIGYQGTSSYPRDPIERRKVAKLFVYTRANDWRKTEGKDYVSLGIYVESGPISEGDRYRSFCKLKTDPDVRSCLEEVMGRIPLMVALNFWDSDRLPRWRFRSEDGKLLLDAPDTKEGESNFKKLIEKINELPTEDTVWVNLHIFSQISKEHAKKLEAKVTEKIGGFLRELVPLYRMLIDEATHKSPRPA